MRFSSLLHHAHIVWLCLAANVSATPEQTVIVTTVVVTSHAPQATAPPSYTSDTVFRKTMLDVTNSFREQHNASALTWNNTLAVYANSWAKKCLWKHSHGPYGENLAVGYANLTAAVDAWGDEGELYNYTKPTGFTEATGHFTQLVWKATTTVGCARVNCTYDEDDVDDDNGKAKGWYVVCEYYPPGNVVGDHNADFKTNVQPEGGSGGNSSNSSNESGSMGMVQMMKASELWAIGIAFALVLMGMKGAI